MKKKSGRKPLGRMPAKVLRIKVPGEDWQWLEYLSNQENMPKPELIRIAVREYLARQIEELNRKREAGTLPAASFRSETDATNDGNTQGTQAGGENSQAEVLPQET